MGGFGSGAFGTSAFSADDGYPVDTFTDSLGLLSSVADRQTAHIASALALALAMSNVPTAHIASTLELEGVATASYEGFASIQDTLEFEDRVDIVFRELIAVSLELGDSNTVSYTAIARVVDALLLSGAVATATEARALIADAMTFGVVMAGFPFDTVADTLNLDDTVAQAYTAIARLIDGLALTDSLTPRATLAVALADTLVLGDSTATALEAITVLHDRLDFVLQINIEDEQYVAWSMNTASRAASRYTNYPFNSFFKVGTKQFAVSDTGLYSLGGPDDAGEPINAKLRLGLSALGTQKLKRIPSMYVGYAGNGDLLLKVIVPHEVTGEREAHVYRLYSSGADSMREGRTKIGRGLKFVYADLQYENVDGAYFDIDTIQFQPLVLDRRLRGNAGGKP